MNKALLIRMNLLEVHESVNVVSYCSVRVAIVFGLHISDGNLCVKTKAFLMRGNYRQNRPTKSIKGPMQQYIGLEVDTSNKPVI